MQQINNGFRDQYYLTEEGQIYDKSMGCYMRPVDGQFAYMLLDQSGKRRRTTIKKLYRAVYNKNFCLDETQNLPEENWKPIERTDELYWISDQGRVKSLEKYHARILRPYDTNGYERVDIVQDGERTSKLVHKLVAEAFLPPPKFLDMQIHHKNHNKKDNAVWNLIYVTPAEHKKLHRKEQSNAVSSK